MITLIIDTSGSMLELGKEAGVLHLACTLKQACKSLGVDFKVLPLKEASGEFKRGFYLAMVCLRRRLACVQQLEWGLM
ncbi:hypothetical protein [Helicobacter suis]|uniref:hypothetical protein n=1 Tax=Helicobacter suis TaxID=104628 RepID=UPI0013D80BE6|nr:hypothetical protein [Helicobacter suis]